MSASARPVTHLVSQARIDRYAELSADFNPIHVDPEFAAGTPFGRTIAHGGIAQQCVYAALGQWLGDPALVGVAVRSTFLAPVPAGSRVTCRLDGVEAGESATTLSISCVEDEGDLVIAATATLASGALPDALR